MSTVFDGTVTVNAYERGSFAPILAAVTATVTPAPPAMPTQGQVWGVAPSTARDIQPNEFMFQIDTTGAPASFTVKLYGSLDGVNFYQIGLTAGYTAAGLYPVYAALASGVGGKIRYVTAALTALTGGTSPTVSCGFIA